MLCTKRFLNTHLKISIFQPHLTSLCRLQSKFSGRSAVLEHEKLKSNIIISTNDAGIQIVFKLLENTA